MFKHHLNQLISNILDAPPNSLMESIMNPKCENSERTKNWGTFLGLQYFGGQRGVLEPRDGDQDEWQASQLFTQTCTNQTTSWLMHSCNTFGAWTSHAQTQTHKTHHGPNLGEATTFPLILFSLPSHGGCTQMSFCPATPKLVRVSKFPKLGLLQLWKPIALCLDFRLK